MHHRTHIIRLAKSCREITVPEGANLMRSLQEAGVPVASSCGGDGVCVKCRLVIESGMKNLTEESDLERFLRDRHDLSSRGRVSCQVRVLGNVSVDAPYW